MPRGNAPSQTRTRTGTPRRSPTGGRLRPSRAPHTANLTAPAVVLALVLGLAGCTDTDPAPEWTPTPATPIAQPTPTPSADPATIKPERPTAMNTINSAGAEAVAVYYMALVPYGYATGDVTELRELADPECVFCSSVIDGVEAAAAAGQRTTGGTPTVSDVSSLETEPGAWWAVAVELTQAPSRALGASGQILADYPEADYHVDLAVTTAAGRWLIREVTPEKDGSL